MSKPAASNSHSAVDALGSVQHLEDELESLRTQLEHSQRLASLGTLAAGVAHEINNILTPALAYAQLAKSHPDDASFHAKAIEKAITGIESASRIAEQILDFASNRSEPANACIRECLEAALGCMARDLAKDRIKLTVNVHAEAVVSIRPLALQQVMLNLILNARTAMH